MKHSKTHYLLFTYVHVEEIQSKVTILSVSSPMAPCSSEAGVTLCGHHCTVGHSGFPSACLPAVLSDQSEEEGQEGRCLGETGPECWQRR